MKVVINKCYGGFGLSQKALRAWAKLKGRECYFYEGGLGKPYTLVTDENESLFPTAFDTPMPDNLTREQDGFNKWYNEHSIWYGDIERDDPDLVRVVEQLGSDEASGRFAKLSVVDVPNGAEYTIEEYDGIEHIAERHRTWG